MFPILEELLKLYKKDIGNSVFHVNTKAPSVVLTILFVKPKNQKNSGITMQVNHMFVDALPPNVTRLSTIITLTM